MVSNPKPPLRGSRRAQPTASRTGAFPIARSPRDHRVVRVHLARTSALDFEGPVPISTPSVENFLLRTSVHRARICACGGPQEPFGLYTITEVNRVEPSVLLHPQVALGPLVCCKLSDIKMLRQRLGGVWALIVLLFLTPTVLNQVPNGYVLVRSG